MSNWKSEVVGDAGAGPDNELFSGLGLEPVAIRRR